MGYKTTMFINGQDFMWTYVLFNMFCVNMYFYVLSGGKSRIGIAEWYTKYIFNLIGNCQIIF